jgi:anti-anti-sigma factor
MVVLDLTEVEMLDGGGLGMLVFLHRWTRDNGIQLKLVNPSNFVREMLDRTHLTCVFNISSMDDVLEILCTPTHVTMDVSRALNRAVA